MTSIFPGVYLTQVLGGHLLGEPDPVIGAEKGEAVFVRLIPQHQAEEFAAFDEMFGGLHGCLVGSYDLAASSFFHLRSGFHFRGY
jgi:hypothetical protein